MKAETLRKSILQYAIQGKLVPQIESEEPARILLQKISAEKQELIKQGKIKKDKTLPPISEDEIPFEIPDGWEWVRFSDIVYFNLGKTPDRKSSRFWNEGIYNWVSIADLKDKKTIFETKEKVSQTAYNQFSNGLSIVGTLLMSFKLTIGKVSILGCDAFHNEAIISIHLIFSDNDIMKMYLFNTLCMIVEFADSTDAIKGSTLNSTKMKNMLVPLPPLEEQKRIVARIEELMVLVDEYEKKQIELDKLETEFPEKLKKSILQYAIQGKLVSQLDSDEPASFLLRRIKAEKEELIKQGKIKKLKPLPPITEDEKPFEIPDSWEWVRISDVCYYLDAGKSPNCDKRPANSSEWGVLTTTSIQLDGFFEDENKVLPTDFNVNEVMKVENGDILITRAGPMNRTGICCLVENISKNLILSDKTVRINASNEFINKEFLVMNLNSPITRQQLIGCMSGMDKQQVNISQENIKGVSIPLPPLAEQKRIVYRIEELFSLVDMIAYGKKLKKETMELPAATNLVVDFPTATDKPKFDAHSLGLVARKEDGVSENDLVSALNQVQEFYDKKH